MVEKDTVESKEQEQQIKTAASPPEHADDAQTAAGDASAEEKPEAKAPDYPAFAGGMESKPEGEASADSIGGLELLRDVNLEVTVELGRTQIKFGEIMELGQGSVIELEKMAGEPVDIRVNGVLMALGEVIVLDDVFGVRITRLCNRVDQLQAMN